MFGIYVIGVFGVIKSYFTYIIISLQNSVKQY